MNWKVRTLISRACLKTLTSASSRSLKRFATFSTSKQNKTSSSVFTCLLDSHLRALNNHKPAVDVDGDGHSEYPALRGSSWKVSGCCGSPILRTVDFEGHCLSPKGKDCNDFSAQIYPGIKPKSGDKTKDTNCNGIFVSRQKRLNHVFKFHCDWLFDRAIHRTRRSLTRTCFARTRASWALWFSVTR